MKGGTVSDSIETPVSRASGLNNAGVFSNPTFDRVNRMYDLFHHLDETTTERMFNKVRPLVPFQSTIPGEAVLNTLEDALD